ncbi:MAG: 30S ribosomal protein S17 [Candidatus Omnitrophota bacterium]
MSERGHRKERIGIVVSDKMDKTIVVKVETLSRHPVYRKILRRSKKFKVHDGEKKAKIGDRVKIAETRPLSKEKRWRLIEVLR